MREALNWGIIICSLMAAGFWAASAMSRLTVTLDAMEAELKAMAWWNRWAALAACAAAFLQFLNGAIGEIRP
jgi:hypothetical protein